MAYLGSISVPQREFRTHGDVPGPGPRSRRFAGHWLALHPFRADLSLQCATRQVNVGQIERYERPRGILVQAAVMRLAEAPPSLDDSEDIFDRRSGPGLLARLTRRSSSSVAMPLRTGWLLKSSALGALSQP